MWNWLFNAHYCCSKKTKGNFSTKIYSSLSSIGAGCSCPPFADEDDDDKIGPERDKNDLTIPPDPADATGAPPISLESGLDESSESEVSTVAASGDDPTLPPDNPPDNPPKPPAELPLNAPNLLVIAAIFGWITACKSDESDVIGTGGTMPYCAFLATFAWSNWLRNFVFASRIPSIF